MEVYCGKLATGCMHVASGAWNDAPIITILNKHLAMDLAVHRLIGQQQAPCSAYAGDHLQSSRGHRSGATLHSAGTCAPDTKHVCNLTVGWASRVPSSSIQCTSGPSIRTYYRYRRLPGLPSLMLWSANANYEGVIVRALVVDEKMPCWINVPTLLVYRACTHGDRRPPLWGSAGSGWA